MRIIILVFLFLSQSIYAQKDAMRKEIDDYLLTLPKEVKVAISVNSLENKKIQYHRNANQLCVAASLIKLPIMLTFFRCVEEKDFSLSDKYTFQETDIANQDGTLHLNSVGKEYSYQELCELMMQISDNSATNILIRKVTKDRVNQFLKKEGLQQTYLNRVMMDTAAINRGVQNFVSTREFNMLLVGLYKADYLKKKKNKLALEIMEGCKDTDALVAGLPENTHVAHKTGTLDGIRSDCGLVLSGHPFAISVITQNVTNENQGNQIIAKIGSIVYQNLNKK